MHRFFLTIVIAWLLGPVSSFAGSQDDCIQEEDAALKIKGCTEAIDSGEWSGEALAWAHSNRGLGHRRQGQLQKALADYNEAIRLRPNYPDAYGNRAYLLDLLGLHEQAITDWETALSLGGSDRVKRAQSFLRDKGFYKGAIDGKYGPNSRKALRACVLDEDC